MRRAAVVFPVHGSPTVRNSVGVGCLIVAAYPSGRSIIAARELLLPLRRPRRVHDRRLPDNESAAAVALTAIAAGGVAVRTVVPLTPEEVDAAATDLSNIARQGTERLTRASRRASLRCCS